MAPRKPIVALDGPAGAGKSTVARELAQALGFLRVDTGALYRLVALAARQAGVGWADGERLGELARSILARNDVSLSTDPRGGPDAAVWFAGRDVSDAIRTPEISQGASAVSAHPPVRAALLELQRQLGRAGGVVVDGRDIGTVVFPDAELKFFLTASADVRARRRFDELGARGVATTYEQTLRELVERDEADTRRPVAPLAAAADAEIVDTSSLSIVEVVEKLAERVRRRMQRDGA
ncbi:MAG TPA: (d)CMP kinase [Polyangiaceae bacterium]|nr:(d)CMP kinase [Polyangiaceae bacterium]